MALWDEGPNGDPVFEDLEVPFRQFTTLYARTLDLGWVTFETCEDDGDWGLLAERLSGSPVLVEDGIFRPGDLTGLTRGTIEQVSVVRSASDQIDSVSFRFASSEIILVAAEAYEDSEGTLSFVRGDESIFVFTSKEDLESVRWS